MDDDFGLPWCVVRLGARIELYGLPELPNTATEAIDAQNTAFELCFNLHALNRGVMLAPYNNTAVSCPALSNADVAQHNRVFSAFIKEICG